MPQAAMLDARTARVLPWLVAIAFFMQTLDGTILNTALPSMARDLAEDPLRMQGVVIAYMLTVALLIPASGWLADRFGYRRILIGNTLLLGSLIASLATIDAQTPTTLLLVHLSLIGMVNSMQFTAMNTVTLVGLSQQNASSGNSLLSVVVQLSMSLGVASAGALLGGFTEPGADGAAVLQAFHLTFLCVGAMSLMAASLFFQLDSKQAMAARLIDEE